MARINPTLLRYYRERQHLSQEQLGQKCNVNKATIFRMEAGKSKVNRDRLIEAIAKALKVDVEDLTRSDSDGGTAPVECMFLAKSQLNVRVTAEVRNALALVSARYNITALEIIEFAPLLFHIVASESLQQRADRLEALRAARASVEAFSGRFPHITERLVHDWQADDLDGLEEVSIAKRDLRGTHLDAGDDHTDPRPMDYDEDEQNPFAVHLKERLSGINCGRGSDSFDGWYTHAGIRYGICMDEARAWFGGDEEAADGFVNGSYSITDMPKEVRSGEAAGRVTWASARRAENQARADQLLASFGLEKFL